MDLFLPTCATRFAFSHTKEHGLFKKSLVGLSGTTGNNRCGV
jgi:hypothetical protein